MAAFTPRLIRFTSIPAVPVISGSSRPRCFSGKSTALTDTQQMTLPEAQSLALKVLKQVMEEKLDDNNVQLAQVTKEKGFEILSADALKVAIEGIAA